MPPRSIFRPLALASVVALSATGTVVGTTAAQASHAGTGSVLTSSNGSNIIRFNNGSTLRLDTGDPSITTMHTASWAPDGSRAIFATENGEIATIRHNDGGNYWWVSPPDGVQRRDPSYRGEGIGVIWAAKEAGQPWRIEAQVASGGFFTPRPLTPDDGKHYLHPDSGPGSLFVYQTQGGTADAPSGTPQVGLFDGDGFQIILDDAANPAISPNGKKVAFVRSDGTRNQIYVANIDGGNVVPVTSNAAGHDNPVWSPDGSTIGFTQDNGVATAPASGGATPILSATLVGVPAYQSHRRDTVARISGQDRFSTATAVSRAHWATASDGSDPRQFAESVVLSRSDLFADALGGAALAAAKQGPLLMTPPTGLNATAQAEIQRILPTGKTVYLLGSPGAISTTVENQVKALGYQVERLAGQDRYSTSVAIANEINPNPDLVLAATGTNFPDALAAGAAAGSYNVPGGGTSAVVVLTADYALPTGTKNYLDRVSATSTIVGIGLQGATATEPYGSIPLFGTSRYETSLMTAWAFFGGTNYAGIATGVDWPDALSGGALMATINGPLLLTQGNESALSFEPQLFFDEHSGSLHTGLVFGSAGVVANGQLAPTGSWISGPGGFDQEQNPTDIGITGLNRGTVTSQATSAAELTRHRTPEEIKAAAARLKERLEQR